MTTKQQQQQHVSRFLEAPFVLMLRIKSASLKKYIQSDFFINLPCTIYELFLTVFYIRAIKKYEDVRTFFNKSTPL